jgi:hypothetical protein
MTTITRNSRNGFAWVAILLIVALSFGVPVGVALSAGQAQSDPAAQGTLAFTCDIRSAAETDSIACRITLDGTVQSPDVTPGQASSYALDPGTHTVLVELVGDQVELWSPANQEQTVTITTGQTARVRTTFVKKAHLSIDLDQPDIVGDFYVDGTQVASQVAFTDLWVTPGRHKIVVNEIGDPASDGAYSWRDSSLTTWLSSGQEKTVTLRMRKVYVMGYLVLKCQIDSAQADDDVTCNIAIDGQSVGTIPPGGQGQFILKPGRHTATVTLTGEDAKKWDLAQSKSFSIRLGRSTEVSVEFELAPYQYTVTLSGIDANTRAIFRRGQALGNKKNVFSKIGDCDTDTPAFLYPFDDGVYNLGDYNYLQEAISYFGGSYGRRGFAMNGGFVAASVLNPMWSNPQYCNPGETPLACEYRVQKPSVALIMLRTYHYGDNWQDNYYKDLKTIVEYSIKQGVIPVLTTIPRIPAAHEGIYEMDDRIRQVAAEYDVPLWDLFVTTETLPDQGVQLNTAHLTMPPTGLTTFFIEPNLDYGMTQRNLEALEVLHRLMKEVIKK